MLRISLVFLLIALAMGCSKKPDNCLPQESSESLAFIDSLAIGLNWPEELEITPFAEPDLVPSPAALAVARRCL